VEEQVFSVIDRDRDGIISTNESIAYANLLKHDLVVRLDGRDLELRPTAVNFPALEDFRSGWGIIQMEYLATPGVLAAGPHKLSFENRHLPAISVYLLNAAKPATASVQITGQKRNENQSTGEIAFDFHAPRNSSVGIAISAILLSGLLAAGIYQGRKKRSGSLITSKSRL
jgi:hypothetical protein